MLILAIDSNLSLHVRHPLSPHKTKGRSQVACLEYLIAQSDNKDLKRDLSRPKVLELLRGIKRASEVSEVYHCSCPNLGIDFNLSHHVRHPVSSKGRFQVPCLEYLITQSDNG